MIKAAKESKSGRQAALVEARWLELYLDVETFRSLRRRDEKEGFKAEKKMLLDENWLP